MAARQEMDNRIRRIRTRRVFIDSRDHVNHRNDNPASYTVQLGETLPNVVAVRLLALNLTYSPTLILSRSSPWYAAGTVLSGTSSLHQKAVAMETAIKATGVDQATRYATITGTDVSVQVVEVLTFQVQREEDSAVKTYDVFICTGTYTAATTPGPATLTLTDHLDGLTYALSPDDGSAAYTDDEAGSGVPDTTTGVGLTVRNQPENLYLFVDAGQGESRLLSTRSVNPAWESRMLFRHGDVVTQSGTRYFCNTTHLSHIFADDLADGLWRAQTDSRLLHPGAAANAFHVVEPGTLTTQTAYQAAYTPGAVGMEMSPATLNRLEVTWRTRQGGEYVFPFRAWEAELATEVASATADRLRERLYTHHTLTLEITYEEDSEVVNTGHFTSIPAGPRFKLPTARFGNPGNPQRSSGRHM